jgi:hypothetical protein
VHTVCVVKLHVTVIFVKKVIDHKMCVFLFPTTFYSETLLMPKLRRDITSTLRSCQILIKRELSQQVFEKSVHIKFHETSSMTTDGRTDRKTDRHDKANSRFSKLLERA